jgi:WD40 repeat protein
VAGRTIVRTLTGSAPLSAQSWSPDGRRLAEATSDGAVIIWDTTTGQSTTMCANTVSYESLNAVAWSPDGKQFALASAENKISLCNVASGQITYTYTPDVTPDLTGGYYSVAWSPDSKEIAFGGADGALTIMDAASKRIVKSYGAATVVYTVSWSRNGYLIACGGYNSGIVAIHPGDSGDQSISFDGDTGATVDASSWSPNGQYVASATTSGLVQIGSLAGKRVIFTYTAHFSTVHGLSWSPDGHTLASADHDGNVEIWQAPL